MKILFFSMTPPTLLGSKNEYNGGGWIDSLLTALSHVQNVSVGYAYMGDTWNKTFIGNQTFYELKRIKRNYIKDFSVLFGFDYRTVEFQRWKLYEDVFMQVVNDYSPDVIHVFGSEREFGLVARCTTIPVVLHIQGILNPYLTAFLPPAFSLWNVNRDFNLLMVVRRYMNHFSWLRNCYREKEIFSNINFFMGRTEWDKRITRILSPQSRYFYCSEILRSPFYDKSLRQLPPKLIIVSTISSPIYKGLDLILKTAAILKKQMSLSFSWEVYGNVNPQQIERNVGIKHNEVNVALKGVIDAHQLKSCLLNSTVYVHPSYIENSSNSICEAQILGCTVIATNVGGTSSLIKDGETGFLVPSNDPWQTAYLIGQLYKDTEVNLTIGRNAMEIASKRHDKVLIIQNLMEIYNKIQKE